VSKRSPSSLGIAWFNGAAPVYSKGKHETSNIPKKIVLGGQKKRSSSHWTEKKPALPSVLYKSGNRCRGRRLKYRGVVEKTAQSPKYVSRGGDRDQ